MIKTKNIDKVKLRNLGIHFIKARQCEMASHCQQFSTEDGNKIRKEQSSTRWRWTFSKVMLSNVIHRRICIRRNRPCVECTPFFS